MKRTTAYCKEHADLIGSLALIYVLTVVIALLAAGPTVKPASGAVMKSPCSHTHVAGMYHAICHMANPTSFHVVGEAVEPYQATWVLTCYGKVTNSHLIAATQSYGHNQVVEGTYDLTVSKKKFPVQYYQMLKSARCDLDVAFTRLRRATAHLLTGTITFNRLPHAIVIYDHTHAGQ